MTRQERIRQLYQMLEKGYETPNWWPAQSPYEVMVGAILTQNTNWNNVEKALENLRDCLTPQNILALTDEDLMERIRPAGFYKSKTRYLKAMTKWYESYDFSVSRVQEAAKERGIKEFRKELRKVPGLGNETTDAILLYAFDLPSFVIDAYTMRLIERLPIRAGNTYLEVQKSFESAFGPRVDVYNKFHALIVIHGKEHCRKRPLCSECPLESNCQRKKVNNPK